MTSQTYILMIMKLLIFVSYLFDVNKLSGKDIFIYMELLFRF